MWKERILFSVLREYLIITRKKFNMIKFKHGIRHIYLHTKFMIFHGIPKFAHLSPHATEFTFHSR